MDTVFPTRTINSPGGMSGRGLITVAASGKLEKPKNVILDVGAARTYYTNIKAQHFDRVYLAAEIKGLIAGNPPYDQERLNAQGLSHITNANFLDAKSLFERTALTFWNLINNNNYLIRFEIKKFQTQNDQDLSTWAESLSRNWTETINEQWPDFAIEFSTLVSQLVEVGLSPVYFKDENSYKWESVDYSRFYIGSQALSSVSKWDYLAIDTPYTMQSLWGIYQVVSQLSQEEQDKQPWDLEALGFYLIDRANSLIKQTNQAVTNMVELQNLMQNGSAITANFFTDVVILTTLLYKEYSGKITVMLFDSVIGSYGDRFLYYGSEQYQEFEEALIAFTYSAGERYIHGNRGVGHKIFPACQALMQLDCNTVDMAKMAGTPIVETQSVLGQNIDPIRFIPGTATNIGTAKLAQNNLGANTGQIINVSQYFERKINKNAQISGDDPSMPDADRGSKSAPEVQMQSIREFGVGKQTVSHFYRTFERLERQMVAKQFHCPVGHPDRDFFDTWKEKCMDEGVPEEVFKLFGAKPGQLPKHLSVRAARVAGDGSSLGLTMGLKQVGSIAGGFSAKGQYNYRADIINSSLGSDYVTRYLGDSQEPDEASGGASLARLENIAVRGGQLPQATKDNQQKAHIGSHMADAIEVIKAIQSQQMDPVQGDQYWALMSPHLTDHIDFLREDALNEQYVKNLEPQIRQLEKFFQLNRVRVQKMQQAELRRRSQEEEALTAEQMKQQREDFKTQKDEQRKDFKVQATVERAKEANQTRAEIMKESTFAKADNERLAVTLKAKNEAEKNRIQQPKELLAGSTTEQLQQSLSSTVGSTPNPADFK